MPARLAIVPTPARRSARRCTLRPAEAEAKLRDLLRKYQGADAEADLQRAEERAGSGLTHALEFWLDTKVKTQVDGATYQLHHQRITDHICPHLGDVPVAGLNPYLVKDWFDRLEKQGCSADLRNKCGQLSRRCLDQCVATVTSSRTPRATA